MSSLLEVLCHDHSSVVKEVRVRLLVNKRAMQKSDMEIFNLKKLNNAEVIGTVLGQNLKQVCSFEKELMIIWTSTGLVKVLGRISKLQPETV
jgi:hypothetical protein